HALETFKTLNGEDVEAVIEGRESRGVDGSVYRMGRFLEVFGGYHEQLVDAHTRRANVALALPKPLDWAPELSIDLTNGDAQAGLESVGVASEPATG
ncbi:MAG TPA: hypothetical protein VED59_00210, partial [Acidimicrobiales bacterium]|nr:hypothetical protein [Acidimicrobiales bacterium]